MPMGIKGTPHLVDERHEVVGDTVGVLADAAAGVCAYGVEVAQRHHVPGVSVGTWRLEVLGHLKVLQAKVSENIHAFKLSLQDDSATTTVILKYLQNLLYHVLGSTVSVGDAMS